MSNFVDLTGKRFGRLIAVEKSEHQGREILWRCVCDCGNEKVIQGNHLRMGLTKSCGCLRREKGRNTTHGMTHSRLYTTWVNLRSRCNNPKDRCYHNYGGRGITYCEEWERFEAFYEWAMASGYNDTLTIDRIDNNKGYCPENCRWATVKDQARNRRSCHLLTYKGETKTLREWEETLGMHRGTLVQRIYMGWTTEKAIETPVRPSPKRKAPTKYEDNAEA